jgi:uncharacterized protein (DUF885 family)
MFPVLLRAAPIALFLTMTGVVQAANVSAAERAAESARANALFERAWQDVVDRNPLLQAQLGIKKDTDKWPDLSEARAAEDLARALGVLAELKRTVNFAALDSQTQLSYRLFVDNVERSARAFPYRLHNYPISQSGGFHTYAPAFLANLHRVDNVQDAEAYVARLRGIGPVFDQILTGLRLRHARGIVPPRWMFPSVAQAIRAVTSGVPFADHGADSPFWADFTRKVGALGGVADTDKDRLLADARAALREAVKPAYGRLAAFWTQLERSATDDDGAWKLPDGPAFYANILAAMTTTSLSAEEIHELGLREVARLHDEMRGILRRVEFSGDLQAFFRFVREDARFYLPNTPEGREEYLARATAVIDDIRGRLDDLFVTRPKAALEVRATETYRERTAPKAFYERGAPDGSRPGVYYSTLYNMREMPTYQIDAIAYHEGLPGHHMQISIAQELEDIPRFRRSGHYTAYIEGWGLYCELLPKEIGLYQDPYADFGRLAMELWRAVRLVVDTGIHDRRWTRQQAIDYFVANTPQSVEEATREIERYIVMPGQATTYKIGMLKILELREQAKRALGPRFELREFHDVVLRDGAVPLDVLEQNVRTWIERKSGPE